MKPSSSKTTTKTTKTSGTIAHDLEEFARRPPRYEFVAVLGGCELYQPFFSRLGLGATVSKSATATIQETARLKGKLSKKPVRGGDETSISDEKKNRKEDGEDDEEEESRNTAIVSHKPVVGSSKRTVVDVFAPRSKKRKRSNSLTEASSTAAIVVNKSASGARAVEEEVSSSSRLSPSVKKRKGKGKNKTVGEEKKVESVAGVEPLTTADQIYHLFDEEWTGFSEDVLSSIQSNTDTVAAPHGPPSSPSISSSSPQTKNGRQAVSLSPVSRRVFSPTSTSTSTSALKTDDQIPLLNLHGPPSVIGTSDAHGEKKKKKRRKSKKRKLEQGKEG